MLFSNSGCWPQVLPSLWYHIGKSSTYFAKTTYFQNLLASLPTFICVMSFSMHIKGITFPPPPTLSLSPNKLLTHGTVWAQCAVFRGELLFNHITALPPSPFRVLLSPPHPPSLCYWEVSQHCHSTEPGTSYLFWICAGALSPACAFLFVCGSVSKCS